jgi:hypothetical protein
MVGSVSVQVHLRGQCETLLLLFTRLPCFSPRECVYGGPAPAVLVYGVYAVLHYTGTMGTGKAILEILLPAPKQALVFDFVSTTSTTIAVTQY